MRQHSAAIVLVASVALVAGCAGGTSGHARPGLPPPFGGATEVPEADRKALAGRTEDRVAACMRHRGFEYRRETRTGEPGLPQGPAAAYGLITPQDARRHGYGMGEDRIHHRTMPPSANDPVRAALPSARRTAWDNALLGTPGHEQRIEVDGSVLTYRPDGCTTIARRDLYGDDWERLRLASEAAVNTVTAAVWGDPGVAAAIGRWSSCMAGRGHHYRHPSQTRPAVDRALTANDPAAFRLEQRIAIADAGCQLDSRLWTAVAAAQLTAERATPPDRIAAISAMAAARAKALR